MDTSRGILKRCSDHMKIPNVSIIEGPLGSIETFRLGEVILKGRSDIVRVARMQHIAISKFCACLNFAYLK